jgi:hypothetical protein
MKKRTCLTLVVALAVSALTVGSALAGPPTAPAPPPPPTAVAPAPPPPPTVVIGHRPAPPPPPTAVAGPRPTPRPPTVICRTVRVRTLVPVCRYRCRRVCRVKRVYTRSCFSPAACARIAGCVMRGPCGVLVRYRRVCGPVCGKVCVRQPVYQNKRVCRRVF